MPLSILQAAKNYTGASRSSMASANPAPVGSTYASPDPPEKEVVFVKKTFVVSSSTPSLSEQMAKYIWD